MQCMHGRVSVAACAPPVPVRVAAAARGVAVCTARPPHIRSTAPDSSSSSISAFCAEEVRFATAALRDAQEHRAQWLARLQDLPCLDKTHLRTLKAKAANAPPQPTLQDVVDDFPDGPFIPGDVAREDDAPRAAADDAHGDAADDDGDAAAGAAVAAAAALGDVPGDAGDEGDMVADDIEAELALEEAAAVAAASAPASASAPAAASAPASGSVAWPDDVDADGVREAYEPAGGIGRTIAADGDSIDIALSHRASLAVLTSRQAHVHLLTVHPHTGQSVIPYPEGMRIPKAHPEFQVDLVSLAHADGTALLRDVRAVLCGDVPEIPARFQKMAHEVKAELAELQVCIVVGCGRRHVRTKMLKQHHLCGDHVDSDLRIVGTDQCVRRCTRCHTLPRVEDFRVGEGSETVGGCCRPCCEAQSKKGRGSDTAVRAAPVLPKEESNGRDEDGSYRCERREAAMRLAQPGESMANPFIVWAAQDPGRGDKTRCIRVGCPNTRKGRDAATLCKACYKVRSGLPDLPSVRRMRSVHGRRRCTRGRRRACPARVHAVLARVQRGRAAPVPPACMRMQSPFRCYFAAVCAVAL